MVIFYPATTLSYDINKLKGSVNSGSPFMYLGYNRKMNFEIVS